MRGNALFPALNYHSIQSFKWAFMGEGAVRASLYNNSRFFELAQSDRRPRRLPRPGVISARGRKEGRKEAEIEEVPGPDEMD